MDIDGLGEKIIDQLIEKGHVHTYPDIFRLKPKEISELTHETVFGRKKASAIVSAIHTAREKWSLIKDAAEEHRQSAPSLKAHLLWLAAPAQLGLKGVGDKTINQLVESGLVKSVDDLFHLSVDQLASLRQQVKVGETTAEKIVVRTKEAKSRGLGRVLSSLGIRLVGATAARSFAEWAKDIDRLSNSSVETLAAVLAKDPQKKKDLADNERAFAEALWKSLKGRQQRELFDTVVNQLRESPEQSSEEFLKARDERLPRSDRLGKRRIQTISECFPTVASIQTASSAEIFECLFEGAAVARSLYDYLHSPQGEQVIKGLRNEGVVLTEAVIERRRSEWSGKTVVITGSFEGFTREQIKEKLIAFGAKVSDSVSSKTDTVFVGAEPGTKHDKAIKLGINIEGDDAVRKLMQA